MKKFMGNKECLFLFFSLCRMQSSLSGPTKISLLFLGALAMLTVSFVGRSM